MTWLKWLPWRFVVSRLARSHGFLDPVALLARFHRFAQPAEVSEPVELLRAGVVFHARGLMNSRVVQHNLDWVWPYWIECQFNPRSESFVPRAFSITHVNLTHRNWTAIGYPDCPELPIVDPRGLLTPFLDGWSLDSWLLADDGRCLHPSRAPECNQYQEMEPGPSITTETELDGLILHSNASVEPRSGIPTCVLKLSARVDCDAWIVLALRPYNPEGVSFIHEMHLSEDRTAWTVDGERTIELSVPAERHPVSDYRSGDVLFNISDREDQRAGTCEVGMVTAAALFRVEAGQRRELHVRIPLSTAESAPAAPDAWGAIHKKHCALRCPEPHFQFLYDAAIASLVLHSPDEVYPGPYTYKRFWFRDAAFIIHALLCAGLTKHAKRALAHFPARQTTRGYFLSQEGEWDSNGEALWILQRYCAMTGKAPDPAWHRTIKRGAEWIIRKRLSKGAESPHAGLLPAGFSAEHLGPSDYYYWDDFWGIAGLRAAASLLAGSNAKASERFAEAGDDFSTAVDKSLAGSTQRLGRPLMPASPYRRPDTGAIGSLAIGYPLRLCAPQDPRLLGTVEYLLANCFVDGAFFQDMIHSGLNAYLTLHVAQVLLRADDARYLELMDTVAGLASPTGQWPEAIHPRTGGGCMGDGHHVWAAAEWVLMIRNCFVREEGERLILGSGIPERWHEDPAPISFGPAATSYGEISLTITPLAKHRVRVAWQANWHAAAPIIEIRLPGYKPVIAVADSWSAQLEATHLETAG
jgi:hypothetical protein